MMTFIFLIVFFCIIAGLVVFLSKEKLTTPSRPVSSIKRVEDYTGDKRLDKHFHFISSLSARRAAVYTDGGASIKPKDKKIRYMQKQARKKNR